MPDSTVIQLANNTDDFFLQLHSNITNICNFSNEHFSKGDSPGTYVYSADSSNIGWHVADNGNKVLYNPHDLSSSSITLSGLRTDPGACANGLREIDVALNIGNRVATISLSIPCASGFVVLSGTDSPAVLSRR